MLAEVRGSIPRSVTIFCSVLLSYDRAAGPDGDETFPSLTEILVHQDLGSVESLMFRIHHILLIFSMCSFKVLKNIS